MTLTTKFLGRTYSSPLMNGAGVRCSTAGDLEKLRHSSAGSFVTKTATLTPRAGNPGHRMSPLPYGSINSMGLPNKGLTYYLDYLTALPDHGANNFLSVAGFSEADQLAVLAQIAANDFAGIVELNLSCPNIPGHPQLAYDFDATDALLDKVFTRFPQLELGVKLPPFFDPIHFDAIARILNQYPVKYTNSINSLGNGFFVDPQTDAPAIEPKGGFGGIGGGYAKPTALANVRALHERLRDDIAQIGTGGVQTGRDVYDLILCGASMVQVATAFGPEGVPIFDRLNQELQDILTSKGYADVTSAVGQLHVAATQ
ncbi:dihydroorotate oxidase [Lacticaseibacillus thailandensis]|uniref:dihydroorotate oxidase (fumarate) n=1 Tax=Lacticaseibacillus thailandensis DSM 22698 = JCM 13996 TaxID=1423810 RepID=A0A0R2C8X4_9LACO|nr:dihydroorotate oxidase [Lacticaseibacillus thailandensis]KRM86420.1 hypothetical protein FD19_GL000748 [Lacticaseibacillus thailandensis DSM 22698 = JCM 13996]